MSNAQKSAAADRVAFHLERLCPRGSPQHNAVVAFAGESGLPASRVETWGNAGCALVLRFMEEFCRGLTGERWAAYGRPRLALGADPRTGWEDFSDRPGGPHRAHDA